MIVKGLIDPGKHFISGNFACAEAALIAGCRFYAGYPITPSSEILERLSSRLPMVGGHFVEMEDEIGSMAAILGAANAGLKSMTATSGPGFSLMQENIGLGMITETPCVVVNEMRSGPSTGIPTRVGQGDIMQAHWGTHGDVESISYCPNSVQEMFDLTITAFNSAEKYRQPVIMLPDQVIGHMSEKIVVKQPWEYEIVPRLTISSRKADDKLVDFSTDFSPMFLAGTGIRGNFESLTHDEMGYPSNSSAVEAKMMNHLLGKIRDHRDSIVEFEKYETDDAETLLVAYGVTSRVMERVVREGRNRGLRIGLFRPITIWPFPDREIRKLSKRVQRIIVTEINYGQYSHSVRENSDAPVEEMHFPPGAVPDPDTVLKSISKPAKQEKHRREKGK